MKDIVKDKLAKYDFRFKESANKLNVQLGLSLDIIIDFSQADKYIITEKLNGGNFLTGMIEMTLKSAMIYNTICLILCTLVLNFLDNTANLLNMTLLLILISAWIMIWSVYYLIRAETFKKQVIDWIEKELTVANIRITGQAFT